MMASELTCELASLAAIVDDVADAVMIIDGDGLVEYANAAVATLFGYAPTDLVGRHYDVLIPVDRRQLHATHHESFMSEPIARPMGSGLLLRARHADRYDFDVTIALVPIRGQTRMVAAIVREVTTSQRTIARLAATNELLTAALGGAARSEVERRSVELARDVLDCESAWLLSMDQRQLPVDLISSSGTGSWEELAGGRSAGESARHDVISCPVSSPTRPIMLLVQRHSPTRGFVDLDQQIVCEFTGALAITLELIDVRAEVRFLRETAEHDRIARDLHDRVIQRLFVIAMRLESVASGTTDLARNRIDEAVDSLDEVIREIRTTIFDLRRTAGPPHVRSSIAAEIDEVAPSLGFAPSLRFVGSMGNIADGTLTDEAPVVLRELLSNAAQHSHARTVDVTVHTDDHVFSITVDDDGVGISDIVSDGDGLRNLRQRAQARNGSFSVTGRVPSGVRAEWSVPITQPDD